MNEMWAQLEHNRFASTFTSLIFDDSSSPDLSTPLDDGGILVGRDTTPQSTLPDIGSIIDGRDMTLCAEVTVLDSSDIPPVPKAQSSDNSLSQDLDLAKLSLKDGSLTPFLDLMEEFLLARIDCTNAALQVKLDAFIVQLIRHMQAQGATYLDTLIAYLSKTIPTLGAYLDENIWCLVTFFCYQIFLCY